MVPLWLLVIRKDRKKERRKKRIKIAVFTDRIFPSGHLTPHTRLDLRMLSKTRTTTTKTDSQGLIGDTYF